MAGGLRNDRTAELLSAVDREIGRRITAAVILGSDRAKVLLSVEGTARRDRTFVTRSGKRKRKGSLIYGATRSAPGEPPRLQTGRLRGSVAFEVDGMTARYGTNVRYGRFLELGTGRMAPRPWLVRSFRETEPAIRKLLTAPIL